MRNPVTDLRPTEDALVIIRHAEAEGGQPRLEAYRCPAGILTIGFGTTKAMVSPGQRITPAQAEGLLRVDVAEAAAYVRRKVTVPLTQNEFDALVSFVHNIRKSRWNTIECTLLRKLNHADYEGAAAQFKFWNKGKHPDTGETAVFAGLSKRRSAEAALFRGSPAAEALKFITEG